MTLRPFSTAFVENRFRVKIAFDTNILMYLLDSTYSKLNDFVLKLSDYREFVDFITNKYALFELYEKRKENHFIKISEKLGYPEHSLNSDKFYIKGNLKYDKLFRLLTCKAIFGDRFYRPLKKFYQERVAKEFLTGNKMFYNQREEISTLVKEDIPRILEEFGIETIGTLHDNLWNPTYELMLNSRISREDSLIAMAFLKPDEIKNERNLALLTNDGDFQAFYTEAISQGSIEPLFDQLGIFLPKIERISTIKISHDSKQVISLRNTLPINSVDVKNYIKRLIIENNQDIFLGISEDLCKKNPKIMGIRLTGEAEYNQQQNLMIIGENLDFVYTIPYHIIEFRDYKSNTMSFPLKRNDSKPKQNKVTFEHVALELDDPDKSDEDIILLALKKSGNLVFVYPNIP